MMLFSRHICLTSTVHRDPKGSFPQQDTGMIFGWHPGRCVRFVPLMKSKLQQVASILQQDPAVQSVTVVGGGVLAPVVVAEPEPA